MSHFWPGTSYWPMISRSTASFAASSPTSATALPLHDAIQRRDWPLLQQLVNSDSVDAKQAEQADEVYPYPPLHPQHLHHQHRSSVPLTRPPAPLLSSVLCVAGEQNGFTPLHRLCEPACVSPHRAGVVLRLLELSASPLTPNRAHSTAFHLACFYAQPELLELFFSHPATALLPPSTVETCWHLAGNVCNDSGERAELRRALHTALQRSWTRLISDELYAVEDMQRLPRELIALTAQFATVGEPLLVCEHDALQHDSDPLEPPEADM